MLYITILLLHVVVCIFLIIVVLLQSGKAADLAGAFGGMGSQTAFGPRGSATLLSKATTVSAVLFMLTSLSLSILATNRAGVGTTVLQETTGAPAKTAGACAAARQPGGPRRGPLGDGPAADSSGPGSGQHAAGAEEVDSSLTIAPGIDLPIWKNLRAETTGGRGRQALARLQPEETRAGSDWQLPCP